MTSHAPRLPESFGAVHGPDEGDYATNIGSTAIQFASLEIGRKIITARDDYIKGFSKFDLSAKQRLTHPAPEEELLAFYAENVLPWDESEKRMILSSLNRFKGKVANFSLGLPQEVYFVKTTGIEEHGAAYTRANAIFLPSSFFAAQQAYLDWLVCHEMFHVISRSNPELKRKLYAIIGFETCNDVQLPSCLGKRKISNPDAPRNDSFIRIQWGGTDHIAMPVIFAGEELYDPEKVNSFFECLNLRLMLLHKDGSENGNVRPLLEGNEPVLVHFHEVGGLYEQIGTNTSYVMHPEEILAENFYYTLFEGETLSSPYLAKGMSSPSRVTNEIRRVLNETASPQMIVNARSIIPLSPNLGAE